MDGFEATPTSWKKDSLRRLALAGSAVALLTVLALAAPAEAHAIIDNGVIQLGIRNEGHLNVPGGSASLQGTTTVGVRYLPTRAEATAPGCTCEGWGAAYNTTTGTVQGGANDARGGVVGMTLLSFTNTSSTAVSVVKIGDLKVTHDYHPSGTPYLYEATVTMENVGSAKLTDVRYRRVMDWDIEPTAFSEYVTINAGATPPANLYWSSNGGFSYPKPYDYRDGTIVGPPARGNFADAGPTDHGALFDFGFGPLEPTATITFKIYYGAAGNETTALSALTAVGAEVYSLGQPSTTNGPTLGEPNTFVFAFADVGGTPPRALPVTTLTRSSEPNANGWHTTAPVEITLSCSVDNSTCNATYYRVDGGSWITYTGPFNITAEGAHAIDYYSTSAEGTIESAKRADVNVDTAPPALTIRSACAIPGADRWCRSPVDVNLTYGDAGSGIATASCTLNSTSVPCVNRTISTDGTHDLDVFLADVAGHTNSGSTLYFIDQAPPAVSLHLACSVGGRPADACPGSVTGHATASDATSGLANFTCTVNGVARDCWSAFTLTADGAYDVRAVAQDVAGHVTEVRRFALVDTMAPALDLRTLCAEPGTNGWCRSALKYRLFANEPGPVAYSTDFATAPGSAWSTTSRATSPSGEVFLGQFGAQTVTLSLSSLPAHELLTIEADLYIINSWDGTGQDDDWRLTVDGVPAIDTTFTSHVNPGAQCWPADCPASYPRATGSLVNNSLGYAADSIYRVSATVPHTGSSATIRFIGGPSESISNEAWGLDNVRVLTDVSGLPRDPPACTRNGAPSTCGATLGAAGVYDVAFETRDLAGNVATTNATLKVDATAPSLWVNTSCSGSTAEGWCARALSLTTAASDAHSGVLTEACTLDGLAVSCGSRTITEGSFLFRYVVTDAAGNTASREVMLRVDKTGPAIAADPVCTLAGQNGWCRGEVKIRPTLHDQGPGSTVYFHDWRSPAGTEWSVAGGSGSSSGESFLGRFGSQSVWLNLTDLPAHDSLTVEFDLYVLRTWDGNGGPDRWRLHMDGTQVVDTTFSRNSNTQCWPNNCGNAANTGAMGVDVLGTIASLTGDSVYHVSATIPHTANATSLRFEAILNVDPLYADPRNDESWGVDNVRVMTDTPGVARGDPVCTVAGAFSRCIRTFATSINATYAITARDIVGNIGAKSFDVKNDNVPPTTTHALNGTAGLDGWHVSTVQVALAASDDTSGVNATYYRVNGNTTQAYVGPFWLAQQGTHVVEYWSVDNAGNVEATKTATVKIDTAPPATSHVLAWSTASNGWYTSPVEVTLSATDATSGVNATNYRVNGGAMQPYTSAVRFDVDGVYLVEYGSRDHAGNVEPLLNLTIRLDQSSPQLTPTVSGTRSTYDASWFVSDVVVRANATDGVSGVASFEWRFRDGTWSNYTGPIALTADGTYWLEFRAMNGAGLWTHAPLDAIKIDRTPPALAIGATCGGALSGTWCGSAWQANATVSDGGSGVWTHTCRLDGIDVTCAGFDVASEGPHEVFTFAYDKAGNYANASRPLGVDTTPPAIANTLHCATPGENGWCRGAANVTFVASDDLSGVSSVACALDGVATDCALLASSADGHHNATMTAVDNVGNAASATQAFRVDTRAPGTSASLSYTAYGRDGWYASWLNLTFSASDLTSGVNATWYRLDGGEPVRYAGSAVPLSEQGWHVLEHWSTDLAGNVETTRRQEFGIDLEKPSTTLAVESGAQGNAPWYVSNVTVLLHATDNLSGVWTTTLEDVHNFTLRRHEGPGPHLIAGDGTHDLSYWSSDNASNGEYARRAQLRIDTAAPTTSVVVAGTAGANGWYVGNVTLNFTATDATSGVASTRYRVDGGADRAVATGVDVPLPDQGELLLEYGSTDVAGNVETLRAIPVKVDLVAPHVAAAAMCATPGDEGWCRGGLVIVTEASDAESGVASATCTLDGADVACGEVPVLVDGVHELVITATDHAGHVSTASLTVLLDATPPAIAIDTACAAAGVAPWCVADNVAYAITAADASPGSGLVETALACLLDGADAACEGNVTGEGVHTLNATVRDRAGHVTHVGALVHVDTRAPRVTESASCVGVLQSGWCRGDGWAYELAATDPAPGSGLAPGEPRCAADGAALACSGTFAPEGTHTLTVDATDAAGLTNGTSRVVRTDRTAPEVSLPWTCATPLVNGWCNSNVAVTPTYGDATSGIASVACTLDDAARACASPFHVPWQGNHTARIVASDVAGNAAEANATFRVDAQAPVIRLPPIACERPGAPGWCRAESFSFDFGSAANDSMSGLDGAPACSVDGGAPAPCSGVVRGQGNHTIVVTARDVAGNVATTTLVVGIDATAPTLRSVAPGRAGELVLQWDAPENGDLLVETGYAIYRATSAGGTFAPHATVGPDTFYLDQGLPPNRTYHYYVVATSAGGASAPSAAMSNTTLGAPSVPLDVALRGEGSNVNLTWRPPEDDGGSALTAYRIYRGVRSGELTPRADVSPSRLWFVEPFSDSSGETTGTVYYAIVALSEAGASPRSPEVSYKPAPVAPPAESVPREEERPAVDPQSSAGPFQRRWSSERAASSFRDRAIEIVIHPDGTRAYAAGTTAGPGGSDYLVVAYDTATGDELWSRTVDTGGYDAPRAITIDSFGRRVLVTGFGNADALTVALNATTGAVNWTARYVGPGGYGDGGNAIVVDHAAETVYVAGETGARDARTGAITSDVLTLAYDAATGRALWSRVHASPAEDAAVDLAVDRAGARVHVAATSGSDVLVLSYHANGNSAWTRRYDSGERDRAVGLALSPNGRSIYVLGSTMTSAGRDAVLVAFDSADGLTQWSVMHDGAALGETPRDDVATGLALAPDGATLYVTTTSLGGARTGADMSVGAYRAATGLRVWSARPLASASDDVARGIVVANDGLRVYVVGERWDGSRGALSAVVASLDASTGLVAWSDVVTHTQGDATFHGAAVSADATVLAVGRATDSAGSRFLAAAWERVLTEEGAEAAVSGVAGATLAPPVDPYAPPALPEVIR